MKLGKVEERIRKIQFDFVSCCYLTLVTVKQSKFSVACMPKTDSLEQLDSSG